MWRILGQLLPAILGIGSGFLGGGQQSPESLPTQFPSLTSDFMDWLSSQIYQKPEGGNDMMGFQAFQGLNGGAQGYGSAQGPGTDIIGQMSPDINSTILPNVYGNWQPWDAGTQYIADFLYNKNPVGQEDPRANQVMTWGGFGGPGHSGMVSALQYGAPSEAGQYLSNLAQFGVTSQPMADFMRAATSGGLNPYRRVPVPPRSA